MLSHMDVLLTCFLSFTICNQAMLSWDCKCKHLCVFSCVVMYKYGLVDPLMLKMTTGITSSAILYLLHGVIFLLGWVRRVYNVPVFLSDNMLWFARVARRVVVGLMFFLVVCNKVSSSIFSFLLCLYSSSTP